ncbi:MAG: VOC family protein [Bacteroidota bacterium]|nr:VOC family protein [Bacteroidota bacterium]MDP4218052.1 VOC family protein [Bacteroidota bacterium]MDP4246851.1 VOC family protein [Bacteroidota bacterium]MDP4254186.1 VOC family protein [Bacteroidota bacterium]MDP4257626.1 VOC family protein [Bacteroidota bacterium]
MTKLNCYLNFQGTSEEAFNFYKDIFGGEFSTVMRFKDVPVFPGKEKLNEAELNKMMHIALPIGDNVLMATDMLESQGQQVKTGNSSTLSVHPDSKPEADRLYKELSQGGKAHVPMTDMFWGYWGMLTDKYGVQWMVNYQKQ